MSDHDVEPDDDPVDQAEFPPLLPVAADDPLGVGFATQIANGVAGTTSSAPPGGVRNRWRPPADVAAQRSGSGPDARDPKPLGDALGRVVRDRQWNTELGVRQLLLGWRTLVGPTIADHSEPVGFHAGVVVVQAESTAWATALRQLAPQVVAKLNEELGDGTVQRIDVRGPAAPSWKHGLRSVRDGRGPRDTYG